MKVERSGDSYAPGHTVGDQVYLLGIRNATHPLMPAQKLVMSDDTIDEFVLEKMLIARDENTRDPGLINMLKIRRLSGQLNKHWLVCKIERNTLAALSNFSNFIFRAEEFIEKKCVKDGVDAVTEIFALNALKEAGIYPEYFELGMGINLIAYQADIKNRGEVVRKIITQVEEKYPEIQIVGQRLINGGPAFYKLIPRPVAQPLEGELMDKDEDEQELLNEHSIQGDE